VNVVSAGVGCGGTNDTSPSNAVGGADMSGGAATTAGGGSGGNPAAGAGGDMMTAGNATGGRATETKTCTGSFTAPELVLAEDPAFSVNGLSVTGDQLELYYSRHMRGSANAVETVVRRTRTSRAADFGPVEALPELNDVCQGARGANSDVTDDGLTLYVRCDVDVPAGQAEGVSPLRVAHRADRESAFSLEAQPVGSVFGSASVGADELTAYSNGDVSNTPPQMFARASKSEPFGGNATVPGFTMGFNSPDISNDGLAIFGSAQLEAGTPQTVLRATRRSTDLPFDAPAKLELGLGGATGSPTITPGCDLYFVALNQNVPGSTVYVARSK